MANVQKNTLAELQNLLNHESTQRQLKNALNENAPAFVASVMELLASDKLLQLCAPEKLLVEVVKAATLKLPLNKNLGMAYIVAYKNRKTGEYNPQFQLGYKGYIQLAIRSGQFLFLNADKVYEGQLKGRNLLTGEIDLSGEPTSNKVIGYFAYMELLTGFSKVIYWSKEKAEAHASRYSASYKFNKEESLWTTNFDEMALKTVTKALLSTYSPLSVDMITGLSSDATDIDAEVEREIALEANQGEVIDIVTEPKRNPEETKQQSKPQPQQQARSAGQQQKNQQTQPQQPKPANQGQPRQTQNPASQQSSASSIPDEAVPGFDFSVNLDDFAL